MQTQAIADRVQATLRASVRPFVDSDNLRWDAFVDRCPDATFFHRIGWREVIETVFRHRTHYLVAERGAEIVGVLPLAEVRSRFFGHSLVSLPFCVYGGPAATDSETEQALIHAASELARSLDVDYLELRDRVAKCPGWPRQDLYVTFRKAILPDLEPNLLSIPRKQRAMVRKGVPPRILIVGDSTGEFDIDPTGVADDATFEGADVYNLAWVGNRSEAFRRCTLPILANGPISEVVVVSAGSGLRRGAVSHQEELCRSESSEPRGRPHLFASTRTRYRIPE